MKRKLTALVLLLFLAACSKHVAPHPHQLSAVDGAAYDALTAAQAVLDDASAKYASGQLPPEAKTYINAAGASYNTLRASWLTYRDVASGKIPGDSAAYAQDLQTAIAALNQNIAAVKLLIGGK